MKRISRFLRRTYNDLSSRAWAHSVAGAEAAKLERLRKKPVLNVAFVAIHRSTWKTDKLYRLMAQDAAFKPFVIVAPDITRPVDWAKEEMQRCIDYFAENQIDCHVASFDDRENRDLMKSLVPDIVIFNNPHGLTCRSLNLDLIENHLGCYIPYHSEVGRYNGGQDQYNRPFHNAMWKIFSPHADSLATYRAVGRRRGANVSVTGYPAIETLCSPDATNLPDPWKPLGLRRIIWAPHHTIDMPQLPYANFLRYAELFRSLVDIHAEKVQWCFKPHPLLKPKLMQHEDWGAARTEEYFDFWANHENAQLELGDYTSLFVHSDAMIHDSGSFLAEYLYTDKPVMYLWSSPDVVNFFNDYGLHALAACERGDCEADIHRFVEAVVEGRDSNRQQRRLFLQDNPGSNPNDGPSDRIIREIKSAVWG